jgi:hypothetical protein
MGIVTLIVTLVYIWILKCFTKPLLYTSLFLIFVLGVGSGYYAYSQTMVIEDKESNDYKVALGGSILIWVVVLLYTIFICCFWKSIALGASIMEAASEFITENKRIMVLPLVAYVLCLPIIAWWTATSIWIYGMGTPYFSELSFIAKIQGDT